MHFCQPCKDLVKRNKKATRVVAFFVLMSLFFSGLSLFAKPVNEPGFCKIYYSE